MAPAVGWQTGSPISGSRAGTVPISCDEGFELAAADVFQIDALGAAGGGFVEIDGDSELAPDLGADALGELDALFERDAFDGNERHDVGRADARMGAVVLREVDDRDGLSTARKAASATAAGGPTKVRTQRL